MTIGLLGWAAHAGAHPDPSHRIERLDALIAASPDEPSLYMARAHLLRDAGQLDRARADYARAARLNPAASSALLGLAMVELDSGRYAKALAAVDEYLAHPAADARGDALLIRARALARDGQGARSAVAYRAALAASRRPRVQHYLEAARSVAHHEGPSVALAILARARAERGAVLGLDLLAIELEVAAGRPLAALAIVDRWLGTAKRPERWYVRRAEVLAQMGLTTEARQTYVLALAAIDALPARLRRTRATRSLETDARRALAALPAN